MKYSLRNVIIVVVMVALVTLVVEVIRQYAFGHHVSVQSVGFTLGIFALFGRVAVSYLRGLPKVP